MLKAAAGDEVASPSVTPDATVARPPAVTSLQRLPFGELTWENFERLCYRLASLTDGVEFHTRYGRVGQGQQGIDIYVRLVSGRYEVCSPKSALGSRRPTPPFNFLDPGVIVSSDGLQAPLQPGLLDRLVVPDVVVRELPVTREDKGEARRRGPPDTTSREPDLEEIDSADANPARRPRDRPRSGEWGITRQTEREHQAGVRGGLGRRHVGARCVSR